MLNHALYTRQQQIYLYPLHIGISQSSFLSLIAKQEEEEMVFNEEDKNIMLFQDVTEDEAAMKVQKLHYFTASLNS